MQLVNPVFTPTQILVALSSLAMVMAQDGEPSGSLDATSIVFGIIFLIVGLFFLVSGKRLLKLIVFLSGAFLFAYLTFIAANAIITWQTASSGQKLAVYICMGILGFVGGTLAGCVWQLGLAILGGSLGSVLGSMLVRTNVIPGSLGRTGVIIAFAVVFAILTFIFHNVLYIIATSIVGFLEFVNDLHDGTPTTVTAQVWAMLASVLVLAAIGSAIQFKTR
ncbi:hypothetical protein L0F63_007113 [Massospora cicadina]|nr:hypothetical protein L0F63_007113 [Massospora cicadina]